MSFEGKSVQLQPVISWRSQIFRCIYALYSGFQIIMKSQEHVHHYINLFYHVLKDLPAEKYNVTRLYS